MLDECFQRLFSSMDPAVMTRVSAKHEKEQNEQLTPIYNAFNQCLLELPDRFFADVFLKYLHTETAGGELLNHFIDFFGERPTFRLKYRHFTANQQQLFRSHVFTQFQQHEWTSLEDSFHSFFTLSVQPKSERLHYVTGTKATRDLSYTLDLYTFLSSDEMNTFFHEYRMLTYHVFLYYLEPDCLSHLANGLSHALNLVTQPVINTKSTMTHSSTTWFQHQPFSYGDFLASSSLLRLYGNTKTYQDVQQHLFQWYQETFLLHHDCLVKASSAYETNLYQLETFVELAYLLREDEQELEKRLYVSFLEKHLQDIQQDSFENSEEQEQYYQYLFHVYSLYKQL